MTPLWLPLALVSALSLAGQGEDPRPTGPSAEAVARATAGLDAALRARGVPGIVAALESAQSVPDAGVVRRVRTCLSDEREEVVLAAVQALRWLAHPDALGALHELAKERKHMRTPARAAAILRAIAQHGHASSVAVLARDPFEPEDAACVRARLLGLAHIRTPQALEALFGIVATTSPSGRERRIAPYMSDARLALVVLTGVDQGALPETWERWWQKNRKTFELPAEPPLLPKIERDAWDQFFGLPRDYERDRRREDRGR
jgi:hypothetical protein